MKALLQAQKLQLRLIESASVNESCAFDLLSIIRKLTATEANSLINIIDLLRNESEFLRNLSKEMTPCSGCSVRMPE